MLQHLPCSWPHHPLPCGTQWPHNSATSRAGAVSKACAPTPPSQVPPRLVTFPGSKALPPHGDDKGNQPRFQPRAMHTKAGSNLSLGCSRSASRFLPAARLPALYLQQASIAALHRPSAFEWKSSDVYSSRADPRYQRTDNKHNRLLEKADRISKIAARTRH